MKEYVIQFLSVCGKGWITVKDYVIHPLKTEEEAREELKERKADHPWNTYRIVVRTVTEWEEC